MAKPEHAKLLLQELEAFYELRRVDPMAAKDLNRIGDIFDEAVFNWNKWRKKTHYQEIDLSNLDLRGPNNTGLLFLGADLRNTDFSNSNLGGALLIDANVTHSNLSRCNLNNASLSHADFGFSNLIEASLVKADLMNTNFTGSNLDKTDFTDAELGWTIFSGTVLSETKGLDTLQYAGPGFIDIETIYRSAGKMPEIFLQYCDVPENFITYMHSLTGKALKYYKCFISFTEADDLFSARLYSDLRAAGVNCWRWKEDAKWGTTLMRSIDQAIHIYDKVVVVCSAKSLNSPAVIREIERALQKEDELARQGKEGEVLFPIRLDDYIFTDWTHHRKADVLAKNVGNFTQWLNPELYCKSFDRFMRDLKADNAGSDRA